MIEPVKRLETISIFAAFKNDRPTLDKIAAIMRVEHFPQDAYIIKEGDDGDVMYILNKGTVRIEKKTLANDKFTVVNLRDDMNIFFGEVALMDNDVRSASVYAITPVECFSIRKSDFERVADADPRIGYYVIKEIVKSLSGRLRKTTQDSVNLIAALISDESES
jgi:CRP/FNR family transcriptional regulator, cyclic AMP receptor protein